MSAWRIPLFDTRFGPDEEAAVLRPLRAGWLTMGEEVVKLEQELRELTGARHAIAVSNCTAALQLASAALGLGPGDEVHFHAGGQGFWVARMIVRLGVPVALSGPLGGESGTVLGSLVRAEGVHVGVVLASRGVLLRGKQHLLGVHEVVPREVGQLVFRSELDRLHRARLLA